MVIGVKDCNLLFFVILVNKIKLCFELCGFLSIKRIVIDLEINYENGEMI